jgi:hypothetical protein
MADEVDPTGRPYVEMTYEEAMELSRDIPCLWGKGDRGATRKTVTPEDLVAQIKEPGRWDRVRDALD